MAHADLAARYVGVHLAVVVAVVPVATDPDILTMTEELVFFPEAMGAVPEAEAMPEAKDVTIFTVAARTV